MIVVSLKCKFSKKKLTSDMVSRSSEEASYCYSRDARSGSGSSATASYIFSQEGKGSTQLRLRICTLSWYSWAPFTGANNTSSDKSDQKLYNPKGCSDYGKAHFVSSGEWKYGNRFSFSPVYWLSSCLHFSWFGHCDCFGFGYATRYNGNRLDTIHSMGFTGYRSVHTFTFTNT